MSKPTLYTTLTSAISDIDVVPDFASSLLSPVTDNLAYVDSSVLFDEDGIGGASITAYVMEEAVIEFPLLSGAGLVLGDGNVTVGFTIAEDDQYLFLHADTFALRLPRTIFVPATANGDGTYTISEDESEYVEIVLPFGAEINTSFELTAHWPGDTTTSIALPLCEITGTGLLIVASDIQFNLGADQIDDDTLSAADLDNTFRGILCEELSLILPDSILDSDGQRITVSGENISISTNGISGTFSISALPTATLFGMTFEMGASSITFNQNIITSGSISGTLTLPFFKEEDGSDATVDVEVSFGVDGKLRAAIADDDGDGLVTVTTVLGDLTLSGIVFGILDDNTPYVELSGSIDLVEIGGIDLPEVSVDGLRITSDGKISMEGGGITLEQQEIINLYGFQVEVDAVGFGTEDEWKYVSFSGGIKLTDGLPAGVSAKGLRILWNDDGDTKIECEGIGISFEVPNVLFIEGSVSLDGSEFTGDALVSFRNLDLAINADLTIGKAEDEDYTYFRVALDTQLPLGIPLASTGLAFYGFSGQFAENMEPDKDANEDWYEDWYPDQPWRNEEGALGLGTGTTVGTLAGNGYMFATDVALVFAFPGPIIMLQGEGNVLRERSALAEGKHIFTSLILFDGNAKSILAALGMSYELPASGSFEGWILDASGTAEAFFDFDDVDNWHVYLGEKEEEKRIRATALSLFTANSYLMLDSGQFATGASIGLEEGFDFEVVSAELAAWIKGAAEISWAPQHLAGELDFDGRLRLSVFGFHFGIEAEADIAAETPTPKEIEIDLSVSLDLPWPLKSVSVDIALEWEKKADPSPVSPVLAAASIRDYKTTDSWELTITDDECAGGPNDDYYTKEKDENGNDTETVALMPLDCRPVLSFDRNVDDINGVAEYTPHVSGEEAAGHTFYYQLKSVQLQKWEVKADGSEDWSDPLEINGDWQATDDTGATKIELFGDGPFSFCRNTISMAIGDITDSPGWTPYSDSFLASDEHYPIDLSPIEIDFEDYDEGDVVTINEGLTFAGADDVMGTPLDVKVQDTSASGGQKSVELRTGGPAFMGIVITVDFPEPASSITTRFLGLERIPGFSCYAQVEGFLEDGSSVGVEKVELTDSTVTEYALSDAFSKIIRLKFSGQNAYLLGFSFLYSETIEDAEGLAESAERLVETRHTFDANTDYRLTIETETYEDDTGSAAVSSEIKYAYFRTGGPPDDLTPYVEERIPSSTTAPHYGAYDFVLAFNENYVEDMYGDLGVTVLDENGEPAAGSDGATLAYETAWGGRTRIVPYYQSVYLGALVEAGIETPAESEEDDTLVAWLSTGESLPANKKLIAQVTYEGAPVYEFVFASSLYSDFSSVVADFSATLWTEDLEAGSIISGADIADFDTVYYDTLGLTPKSLPDQPEVTALLLDEKTKFVLLEFPEPVEWDRVTLKITSPDASSLSYSTLVNNDGTRALLYIPGADLEDEVQSWQSGDYSFAFAYDPDLGDDEHAGLYRGGIPASKETPDPLTVSITSG